MIRDSSVSPDFSCWKGARSLSLLKGHPGLSISSRQATYNNCIVLSFAFVIKHDVKLQYYITCLNLHVI